MRADPRRPVYHGRQDSPDGTELVLCLYTRGCVYGACSFCSLPALSAGEALVASGDIRAQVDHVLGRYEPSELASVRRVSVYNSGSVLDQRTLPTDALLHLIGRLAELPGLRLAGLDTRAEFVEDGELEGLKSRLVRVELELAVGYETQDERIRNRVLRKGLSERAFESLCRRLAAHGVRLKAYVMVKPDAALSEREGVEEAVRTLERLAGLQRSTGARISAHLNPTYVAKGSRLEAEFRARDYSPPRLWSVVEILERAAGLGVPVRVGLHTEGLAVAGGTFRNCGRCDARVREALRRFSSSQDPGALAGLGCPCRGAA